MPSRGTKVDVLVAWTVCTQPNQHILQEAWRRFHSGYSSFSLLLWPDAILGPPSGLGRCLLTFCPLLCALLIAISRLDDYRHDVWDVTCGGLLGLLVSWFSYRRYYHRYGQLTVTRRTTRQTLPARKASPGWMMKNRLCCDRWSHAMTIQPGRLISWMRPPTVHSLCAVLRTQHIIHSYKQDAESWVQPQVIPNSEVSLSDQ
ncbi:unnamed protein product [Penicillium nalgiovense]|nr:unnamed protein product [Penicillium nalgiovense]